MVKLVVGFDVTSLLCRWGANGWLPVPPIVVVKRTAARPPHEREPSAGNLRDDIQESRMDQRAERETAEAAAYFLLLQKLKAKQGA